MTSEQRPRPGPGKGRGVPAEESASAAPPAPTRRRDRTTVLVASAAVVLLAAAVVFAVLWVQARGTASDRSDAARTSAAERTRVLATAQKVAIDFSSYDYRRLDANFARVAGQLTGSFATSYRATSTSLKATLSQYQAVGTAKVLDAGVASLGAKKAVVVVFLDQTVTSKVSKTPTVDRNRVRVTLQRSGERWLVSALDLR